MKKSPWLIALLCLGLAAVSSAWGSWAAVPLEILVDEATVVVQGKVAKIDNAGFKVGERNYEAAVVEVSAVLKGPEKLKEVRIAQPAAGGLAVSTDIRFRAGQDQVWLLNKDPERDIYWARHPSQVQPTKDKDTLAKLVEARAKLAGGKEVNGLVARAEVVEQKAEGAKSFEIRFSLKNVSDKPINVCHFVGNRPLELDWTGPDGKKKQSKHYDWLQTARLKPPAPQDFTLIAPGGVVFLGSRGLGYSGIYFSTGKDKTQNTVEAGEQKVIMTFTNKDDGKKLGQKDVWTGTVSANEVKFTVK